MSANSKRHFWHLWNYGFNPASIPGLQLWLDASVPSSLTLDVSNNVSEWRDLSGNGRHFSQAMTARMPSYVAAVFGSLPAVRTDGNDDLLETASLTAASMFGSGTQGFTAAYAGKRQAETGRTYATWWGASNQRFWFDRDIPASSTSDGLLHTPANADFITAAPYNGLTPGVNIYRWTSGTAWSLRRCVAGVSSTFSGGVVGGSMTSNGTLMIGSDFPSRGNTPGPYNFGEFAWYNRELTNGESALLETYFAAKWGI